MQHNNENLLLKLSAHDQTQLLNINKIVAQNFLKSENVFWQELDKTILELIKPISFSSIAASLPVPADYYRIRVSALSDPVSVVLFVFKTVEKNGQVILLHTYNHHEPNDIIYPLDSIINPKKIKEGHLIRQTPPHTHKAMCHSCIAWMEGSVTVTEQFYRPSLDSKIKLTEETKRIMHHCNLDDDPGKIIHSVSVTFF